MKLPRKLKKILLKFIAVAAILSIFYKLGEKANINKTKEDEEK